MSEDSVAKRVIDVIARHTFEQREIGLDDTVEALKIDSLAMAEIMFDLEEEFDIVIEFNVNRPDEDENFRFATVREAVQRIEELAAQPSATRAAEGSLTS